MHFVSLVTELSFALKYYLFPKSTKIFQCWILISWFIIANNIVCSKSLFEEMPVFQSCIVFQGEKCLEPKFKFLTEQKGPYIYAAINTKYKHGNTDSKTLHFKQVSYINKKISFHSLILSYHRYRQIRHLHNFPYRWTDTGSEVFCVWYCSLVVSIKYLSS